MRFWILPLLGVVLWFALVPAAAAQQPVFRCIGAHGEPVFSGQPCGAPAPARSSGAPLGADGIGSHCAVSPQALREAIAGAFTAHDVNQLAGLLVWRGMGQASVRARMQSLAQWLREPLSGIATTYGNGPPASAATTTVVTSSLGVIGANAPAGSGARGAPTGFAVSTGGGDGGTRDFGVVQSGGCWWLTFPD